LVLTVPPTQPQVEYTTRFGHPGLRHIETGRWLTPEPPKDPITLRWYELMGGVGWFSPQSYSFGVIDAKGRMVVPFLFDALPDVQASGQLQICRKQEGHKVCEMHRLPKAQIAKPSLQPVQQAGKLWGYADRTGHLALPAVYDTARRFVNGYAIVSARLPLGWIAVRYRQPIVIKITRVGHAWAVQVVQQGPLERGGANTLHTALMDDQGRWLVPGAD
jgi:hypothetical protein